MMTHLGVIFSSVSLSLSSVCLSVVVVVVVHFRLAWQQSLIILPLSTSTVAI